MHRPVLLFIALCFWVNPTFSQDSTRVYSIKFTGFTTKLSKESKSILGEVAALMRKHPDWYFAVTDYCGATENTRLNVANWDRVNNIIIYLSEKLGIKAERFIFNYGAEGGDCTTIDLALTDQLPPNNIPPPHPHLRKSR